MATQRTASTKALVAAKTKRTKLNKKLKALNEELAKTEPKLIVEKVIS